MSDNLKTPAEALRWAAKELQDHASMLSSQRRILGKRDDGSPRDLEIAKHLEAEAARIEALPPEDDAPTLRHVFISRYGTSPVEAVLPELSAEDKRTAKLERVVEYARSLLSAEPGSLAWQNDMVWLARSLRDLEDEG